MVLRAGNPTARPGTLVTGSVREGSQSSGYVTSGFAPVFQGLISRIGTQGAWRAASCSASDKARLPKQLQHHAETVLEITL